MTLKPDVSIPIAMVSCGAVLAVGGFAAWFGLGFVIGLIPGVGGMLGLMMFVVGLIGLAKQTELSITIDESGISVPRGHLLLRSIPRLLIARDEIISISRHESRKGRMISIQRKTGGPVMVQARHYCDLDVFLSHCKRHGLPVS